MQPLTAYLEKKLDSATSPSSRCLVLFTISHCLGLNSKLNNIQTGAVRCFELRSCMMLTEICSSLYQSFIRGQDEVIVQQSMWPQILTHGSLKHLVSYILKEDV